MVEDTVILSFDSQQLKRIKLMQPEIKTLLLIQSFYGDLRELARATYADYYGLSITFFDNNTTFLSHAHEYDKKVYIWTVKDQAIMRRMVEADVDGLITDRPVLAREVVYSKNAPELLIEILKRFFKTYEQGLL
jgi:glycerophosphoryl diester phosphodiesterase